MSYFGLGMIVVGAVLMFIDGSKDFMNQRTMIKDLLGEVESIKKERLALGSDFTSVRAQAADVTKLVADLSTKVKELDSEVINNQEHLAKIRNSQLILKEKLADKTVTKKVLVKHIGSVPVEMIPATPREQIIKKVKKQLEVLSK